MNENIHKFLAPNFGWRFGSYPANAAARPWPATNLGIHLETQMVFILIQKIPLLWKIAIEKFKDKYHSHLKELYPTILHKYLNRVEQTWGPIITVT